MARAPRPASTDVANSSDPSTLPARDHLSVEAVRLLAGSLPRSDEALVNDRIKFRVGRIVWLAFSRDESAMGFAFPKEQRASLVAAEPDVFFLPRPSELRYNWVESHLDRLEVERGTELLLDAWAMCVPKRVREQYWSDVAVARRRPSSRGKAV